MDLATAVVTGLLFFALYLLPSLWRPLTETAEARIAVVAEEMIASGDWILPMLNGKVRLEKPPLPYWLTAGVAMVLGPDAEGRLVSEQAPMAVSAGLAAFAVVLLVLFGSRVFGRAAGIWAGTILGLSFLFHRCAQTGSGEIALSFFTAAALCAAGWLACVRKPGWSTALWLGLSLGLGILVKGHIALLLVLGALLVHALRVRRINYRKLSVFFLAMLVAMAVALPWFILVRERAGNEGLVVMSREVAQAVGRTGHVQNDRAVFYFYQLAGALLPWTPLLLLAWPLAASHRRAERKGYADAPNPVSAAMGAFFLASAVAGFAGFYAVSKQQAHYLLPLLAPLALWGGWALSRLYRPGGKPEERMAWLHLLLGLLLGVGVALAPRFAKPEWGLGYGLSVPLGALTLLLYVVASRQWVEGRCHTACLCTGLAVYGIWVAVTVVTTLAEAQKRDMDWLRLQAQGAHVYTLHPKVPFPSVVYYFDRSKVGDHRDLKKECFEPDGTPRLLDPEYPERRRMLLCRTNVAQKLGQKVPDARERRVLVPLDASTDWKVLREILDARLALAKDDEDDGDD
ncbi:MAG: glycosyltransferase family 39 protein [Planctomycetes bacterium]|nr:glycosyltransferase family 39 protein [Planctomycetota bacterium]